MANDATLAQLKARALDRADMTGSTFIDTDRLRDYINEELGELHDLLISAYEDYYRSVQTITLVANTESYALASDFYKALKVYLVVDGRRHKLERFNLDDLDVAEDPEILWSGGEDMLYGIYGSNIFFTPKPSASGTVELWYAPQLTKLSGESDVVSVAVPVSWEAFVVVGAAAKCLAKEESMRAEMDAEKERLRQRIIANAGPRDAAEPRSIVNVYSRSRRRMTRWGRV